MLVNARKLRRQLFFAGNFFREIVVRTVAVQRRFPDKAAAFNGLGRLSRYQV